MKLRTIFKAALLLTALAAVALALDWRRRYGEGPGLTGRPLLPPDARLRAADLLLLETPAGQVTLRRVGADWVVAEEADFPANRQRVRQQMLALAQAHIGQKIGTDPDTLGRLGLLQKHENGNRFEAGRTASVFSLVETKTGRDKALFQVLIGNRREGGGTYVRIPGSSAVYLVDADLRLDGDAAHWIRRRILPRSAADALLEIIVRPQRGPPFRLWRGSMGAPWRLEGADHSPHQEAVQALARAVTGLDIAKAGSKATPQNPSGALTKLHARLADGWELEVRVLPESEGGTPVRVSARLSGGAPGAVGPEPAEDPKAVAVKRVKTFNAHYAQRTLTIEPATAKLLMRGRAAYTEQP